MKKFTLKLSESQQIKEFVNIVNKYSFDMDLRSGKYVVDAKSILGIFSLDLSQPVDLEILTEDNDEAEKFIQDIKKFIV